MARTKGSKNADHSEQRMALARKVRVRLQKKPGSTSSFRDMADAAGTSVTTLKHYFNDRIGVQRAVLESLRLDAAPHLAFASTIQEPTVRESLAALLTSLQLAWSQFDVGRIQAMTLAMGLGEPKLGPAYVNFILEPLLQTAETRIRQHVERGELPPCNERYAALQLLCPVVMALFHQDSLSGASCRPLDLDDFFQKHLAAFFRAYPPRA